MLDKPIEEMTLDEMGKYIAILDLAIAVMKCRKANGNPITAKQALEILDKMESLDLLDLS